CFAWVGSTYSAGAEQLSNLRTFERSNPQSNPKGATPTLTPCVNGYTCAVSAGATIVPGTVDTGNHTDDGVTNITLPFPVTLYNVTYTSLNVSSNGNAQFVSANDDFNNVCLPV